MRIKGISLRATQSSRNKETEQRKKQIIMFYFKKKKRQTNAKMNHDFEQFWVLSIKWLGFHGGNRVRLLHAAAYQTAPTSQVNGVWSLDDVKTIFLLGKSPLPSVTVACSAVSAFLLLQVRRGGASGLFYRQAWLFCPVSSQRSS